MFDPVAEREREKYKTMWAQPFYRVNSPGLNAAPEAFRRLRMRAGDTLIDYGCGIPKAVNWFRSQKIAAIGIDHVALDRDVVQACLWDLPADLGPSHWAYCADVMEHIPPSYVDRVLLAIRERTTKGAYFQIATCEDKCGKRLGLRLHLTVRPALWWRQKLEFYFGPVVQAQGDRDWRFGFYCSGEVFA